MPGDQIPHSVLQGTAIRGSSLQQRNIGINPIFLYPTHTMSKFVVHSQKGFQVTFDNGYEVSVMFGRDNYCERKDTPDNAEDLNGRTRNNCEVAVFLCDKLVTEKFSTIRHKVDPMGRVAGWVSPNEIAALMAEVAAYKA
jgi:hypothetical protein